MPDDAVHTLPEPDAIRLTRAIAARIDALAGRLKDGAPGLAAPIAAPEPGGAEAALVALFGLDEAERALLATAVAVAVEPALEIAIADLQAPGWCPVPREALVRALFGLSPGAIWRPTSGLAVWQLVAPVADPSGAASAFSADPRIVDWLQGKAALDAGLVGHCSLPESARPGPGWPLEPALSSVRALSESAGGPVRLHLAGPAGSGRRDHASSLAQALGSPALLVDGSGFDPAEVTALYLRLQRFARLAGRCPVWTALPPCWPGHLPASPFQIVLLTDPDAGPRDRAAVLELGQPELSAEARDRLWHDLAGVPLPLALSGAGPGELRAMAPLARIEGAVAGSLRDRARLALAAIGQVRHPGLTWDDLVLPAATRGALQSLADEAQRRRDLMTDPAFRRLFARDAAPTALFSGPPGVGKTMAADCIAAELGAPLLVVDVSRMASRYIGETAKALSRAFAAAQRFGCVLFFDEADATFSRRTEVRDSQDRHANADTGHLLQLIEAYEGCVILGTNRRANIDEAFLRRIRHVIEFHKPERAERVRLWQMLAGHLFAPAETAAASEALAQCGARLELTPAQIKAALLTARYDTLRRGAPVDLATLLAAARREMAKEGRALPPDLAARTEARGHVA